MQRALKSKIIFELASIFVISTVSLSTLLFSKGYYSYSDQNWSFIANWNPVIISLNPFSAEPFTRIFVTWPYFLFESFSSSIQVISRLFVFYTFVLLLVLMYIFANLAVKVFKMRGGSISDIKAEVAKLAIVIFMFSNISMMYLNADGGTFSDSLIMVFIAISILLIGGYSGKLPYFIAFSLTVFSSFLDSGYIPLFWMAVLIPSLVFGRIDRNLASRLKWAIISILLTLPATALIMFLHYAGGPLLFPTSQLFRQYSLLQIEVFSRNINYFDPFVLLGYLWSTMTFGPPSILSYGDKIYLAQYLFYPAQVVYLPGIIYYLWLVTIAIIPVLSFLTLIFRKTRDFAFASLSLMLLCYILTEQFKIPFVFNVIYPITRIPMVGTFIGATFADPYDYIFGIAVAYYVMFAFFILGILDSNRVTIFRKRKSTKRLIVFRPKLIKARRGFRFVKNPRLRYLIVVFVFFVLIFSGWQAFNGSFYPERSSPSSVPVGNGIYPGGSFTPQPISQSIINAYYYVYGIHNRGDVLWIGNPLVSVYSFYFPEPTISLNGLNYLVTHRMYYDIHQYLLAHSVEFVVLNNNSLQEIAGKRVNPFSAYGFGSYTDAKTFLERCPGMTNIINENGTSVFYVLGVSSTTYNSNLLLNYSGSNTVISPLYELFDVLGYNVTFSGSSPYDFNVDAPSTVQFLNPTNVVRHLNQRAIPVNGKFYSNVTNFYYNSSSINESLHYYQNNSLGEGNVRVGNFTTTSWGGNTTVNFNNGRFSIYSIKPVTFSTDYNYSLAGSPGGIYVPSNNSIVPYTVSFEYSVGSNFTGNLSIITLAEASNTHNLTLYKTYYLKPSINETKVVINALAPEGTKYFGFRIWQQSTVGQLTLKFLNFSYFTGVGSNVNSPSGESMQISNSTFSFPGKYAYIIYESGIDRTNVSEVTYLPGQTIFAPSETEIYGVMLSNYSLSSITGHYLVINQELTKVNNVRSGNVTLRNPSLTVDGGYVFRLSTNAENIKIVQDQEITDFVLVAYFLLISVATLPILLALLRFKKDLHA